MPDNSEQIAYWNGEVGERWAARQRDLDAAFAPLTQALFEAAAPPPGASVLDIGCGAGETALIAARRVGPQGRVTGADISAPLLAVARERAAREPAGAAPVDWIEADAERHDLGAARFDHVLSRFGVMFFADSQAAFANLRRALAPGGRLTFLCWRAIEENPWVALPREAVLPLVPDFEPPPAEGPGPFRFADGAALKTMLSAAGFREIDVEPVSRELALGASPEEAARFVIELGPVSRLVRDRDDTLKARARDVLVRALADHARGGRVALGAACWLVTAGN